MTTPTTLLDAAGRPLRRRTPAYERPKPPATAPSTWDYATAKRALEAAAYAEITPDEYLANQKLAEAHEHWDGGRGWMGPNGGTDEVWRLMAPDVERQFTPVDVTSEALTRFANALLKREPSVEWVPLQPAGANGQPSDEQITEATAARRAQAAWWDRVKLWRKARTVTKRARWATRGVLRDYVDEAQYVTEGVTRRLPAGLSIDAAFARVSLSAPPPTDAGVVTDLTTGRSVGILLYTRRDGDGPAAPAVEVAQLWIPGVDDADRNGVGQRMTVREVPARGEPTEYTIGVGRLPFAELAADLLVTEPVRRQQARLNFAESTVPRATETSGFPERYILNAEPTGIWFDGAPEAGADVAKVEENPDGSIKRHMVRLPFTLGAAVVTSLIGIETGVADATGAVARAEPEVVIKEPSDPEYVLKTARHSRATMLQSVSQGHVLRPTDSQVSGYSQEQARADFEDDATNVKAELEAMLRDVLEGAMAWALAMVGDGGEVKPDFLSRFRCVVTLTVSAGPRSPAERAQILAEYQAGLLSQATAMSLLGVEDVDAELALLGAGEAALMARVKVVAEAMAAVAAIPGGTVQMAARALEALGADPALVRALVPRDMDGIGTDDLDDDPDDPDENDDPDEEA